MHRRSTGGCANPNRPVHPAREGGGPGDEGDAAESGMKAEAVAPFRRSRISPGHRAPVEREGATCAIQELKMRQKGQGGVGAATIEPVRERMVTEVGR